MQPGSIDGQMFDIADCENSTLVVLDHCEQVQMDVLKKCRVFIGEDIMCIPSIFTSIDASICAQFFFLWHLSGAGTSTIFIRNCVDCVFYTCCRQLRITECKDCQFYVYSTAEVHIEVCNGLAFAPFNGGYPQHAEHLQKSNLPLDHNLWYDIFDHDDPGKTRKNWSLIDPAAYEKPWFPLGECEPAIPLTVPGTVNKVQESGMQSFGANQFQIDAQKPTSPTKPVQQEKAKEEAPPLPPAASEDYEIYYHAGFTGRSLPIQMLLRDKGIAYKVVPAIHDGTDKVVGSQQGYPVFACPAIKKGDFVLSQTNVILSYLGKKHGLAPTSDEDIAKCDQLTADASDVVSEVFKHSKDEDKGEAFLAPGGRLSTWFAHFDKCLSVNSTGPFLFGENPTYADFNLVGLIDLLQFFFDDKFAPLVSENMTNWLGACVCRNSYMALQAEGLPILPASFK